MKPEETQLPHNELRGNLGFITEMHKQLLEYKSGRPSNAPQTSQNAPGQESDSKHQDEAGDQKLTDLEGKMEQKMEILRTELKDTIKTEIGSIKDEIKNALENEQE